MIRFYFFISFRLSENYILWRPSSATLNFFLPLARRAANTLRPFAVAILSRNPCLFLLFLFEGWNVLFIALMYYINNLNFGTAKIDVFF